MDAVIGAATDAAMNSSNTQQPPEDQGEDQGEDQPERQPARSPAAGEVSTWKFVKWSAISLVCVVALGVAVARVLHELGIE